jgi:hypothetical protein
MDEDDTKKQKPDHLIWAAAGGALVGAWYVKNRVEESKKSRAERDDPDGVQEVCEEISRLLDDWQPNDDCESEDDFTHDMGEYLIEESGWEIEVMPNISGIRPDILIGNLLALELKLYPSKTELDRCVGQCAGYSRQWVTWIVLIDTPASRIGWLEDLLSDKGLERILVWDFS